MQLARHEPAGATDYSNFLKIVHLGVALLCPEQGASVEILNQAITLSTFLGLEFGAAMTGATERANATGKSPKDAAASFLRSNVDSHAIGGFDPIARSKISSAPASGGS